MYTKEQILSNSSMAKLLARQGRYIKGVLTTEEQNQLANKGHCFQVITDGKVFFFTDDYCIGVHLFPKTFVPSSSVCPFEVKPRECLPDGIIVTAEQYIMIFEKDKKQINTIDELVDYLNKEYG